MTQLFVCGAIFEAAAQCNGGKPPLGVAFDGGSTNACLSAATLGLLPLQKLAEAPFFASCKYVGMRLKMLPYKYLVWKDEVVLGSQDSLH